MTFSPLGAAAKEEEDDEKEALEGLLDCSFFEDSGGTEEGTADPSNKLVALVAENDAKDDDDDDDDDDDGGGGDDDDNDNEDDNDNGGDDEVIAVDDDVDVDDSMYCIDFLLPSLEGGPEARALSARAVSDDQELMLLSAFSSTACTLVYFLSAKYCRIAVCMRGSLICPTARAIDMRALGCCAGCVGGVRRSLQRTPAA